MHLDLRTLTIVIVLIQAMYSMGLFLVSKSWIKSHGLNLVAIALGLGAAGWLLIALRDVVHPFLSIIIANIINLGSHVFTIEGIVRLRGIKSKTRLIGPILLLLTLPIITYLTFISPSLRARIIVMSLFIGILSVTGGYLLLKDLHKKHLVPAFSTAFFFVFASIIMLIRIFWTLYHADWLNFMASDFGIWLIQLSYVVYVTGITFGLIWLSTMILSLDLTTALKDVESGFEDKLNFINIISHELKTPVATIQNSLESLQIRLKSSEPAIDKILMRIQRSTSRLTNFVNSGVDQQSLLASLSQHDNTSIYISELLETTVQICKESSNESTIKIEYDPPQLQRKKIFGNKNTLLTALNNVLENSLKFSPAKEDIIIHATSIKKGLLISIKDKGSGIALEGKEHLFSKYFRGTNIGNVPGSGIGLFLVKHIINAHRGTVHIGNRKSGGCRVDIYLPFQGSERNNVDA